MEGKTTVFLKTRHFVLKNIGLLVAAEDLYQPADQQRADDQCDHDLHKPDAGLTSLP
jgi:putative hemolysin